MELLEQGQHAESQDWTHITPGDHLAGHSNKEDAFDLHPFPQLLAQVQEHSEGSVEGNTCGDEG